MKKLPLPQEKIEEINKFKKTYFNGSSYYLIEIPAGNFIFRDYDLKKVGFIPCAEILKNTKKNSLTLDEKIIKNKDVLGSLYDIKIKDIDSYVNFKYNNKNYTLVEKINKPFPSEIIKGEEKIYLIKDEAIIELRALMGIPIFESIDHDELDGIEKRINESNNLCVEKYRKLGKEIIKIKPIYFSK